MVADTAADDKAANSTVNAATLSQKRDVYATGFGKFGDILENPTTFLAKKLAEHHKVTESHVLEVSAEGCVEALADMYARAEECGRPCIFLHFGDEVIHEGEPDNMTTEVPLEEMRMMLQAMHPRVDISTDPGRYICNYVYYRSLVWAKRQATKDHSRHLVLFVHVPEFRVLGFDDQVALASRIVDMVADL
ncbi:unnamed protein product [Peronospora destructor]|uniref:Uncharacterized protein n=1 Tax=Peronospora destructor TaxID=86335 RepID=A0AAV0VF82_9STRA|nr:unnamed protein product [Peronospora destructor]